MSLFGIAFLVPNIGIDQIEPDKTDNNNNSKVAGNMTSLKHTPCFFPFFVISSIKRNFITLQEYVYARQNDAPCRRVSP
jgi:hypothetical protein